MNRIFSAIVIFMYRVTIKLFEPLRILAVALIKCRVFAYGKYAKVKRRYGADCVICTCALLGTGDYYFNGMYLKTWLEKNNVNNYVFNVPTPQHLRIVKMFDYMHTHAYNMGDNYHINGLKFFLGDKKFDYHYFFCVGSDGASRGLLEMAPKPSYLLGYRGFSILDCYLRLGLGIPYDTVPIPAKFSDNATALLKLISISEAVRGNTIVLSPYAASYEDMPKKFWRRIIWILERRGYCLLINVGKKQKPLKGTSALFLPYELSVPFLDYAGGFIGIRSGFCDIISTSKCKKVVIHPHKAINWQDGTSLGFCGLKHMGLCDAVEPVLSENNANEREVTRAVLREFP